MAGMEPLIVGFRRGVLVPEDAWNNPAYPPDYFLPSRWQFDWGGGKPLYWLNDPVRAILDRYGPDAWLLFMDAHDAVVVESGAELIRRFKAIQAVQPNIKVIATAERKCFPLTDAECELFPLPPLHPGPNPYRYLNSGAWMGRAKDVLDMLLALPAPQAGEYTVTGGYMDQGEFQKLFLNDKTRDRYGMALDYNVSLFQAMHMAWPTGDPGYDWDLKWVDVAAAQSSSYDTTLNSSSTSHATASSVMPTGRQKFCNVWTGHCPAVVHFNGGSKGLQVEFDLKLEGTAHWNTLPEPVKAAYASVNVTGADGSPDKRLTFRDVCCDPQWTGSAFNKVRPVWLQC